MRPNTSWRSSSSLPRRLGVHIDGADVHLAADAENVGINVERIRDVADAGGGDFVLLEAGEGTDVAGAELQIIGRFELREVCIGVAVGGALDAVQVGRGSRVVPGSWP